jgi:MoaA/NifB/PqqE/SkfB family radical SAM enzyme
MKSYNKRALRLILDKPGKIPALIRLMSGVKWTSFRRLADDKSMPPISISIAVTYRCNLRCIQCGQWGETGWVKEKGVKFFENEMTTEQFKTFISDVASFRPYLQFTGGEPLLRKDIFELIRFADSKNLATGMTTNGTLLEENAENIVKSGLEYLYVSLDGPVNVNKDIRKGVDSSIKVIRGIQAVMRKRAELKYNLPFIEVRMTVIKENQHAILETADFVEKHIKPEVFCVMPEFFVTKEMYEKTKEVYKREFGIELRTVRGEIRDVSGLNPKLIDEQIKEIKKRGYGFKFRLCEPIGKKGFSFSDYFKNPNKMLCGLTWCSSQYSFALLEPEGGVATCAGRPDYIAGNVLNKKFLDIWNGERYKRFRRRTNSCLFPMCSRCRHIYKFAEY